MLKIYTIPISLYCAKLRILLRHKQLEWIEQPPPGGYGSEEYQQLIPAGNLPAMIDGDLVLADSEAIAEYLNEKYPTPPMLPSGLAERGQVRQLSRFHDTRLEPEVRALFGHITPSENTAAIVLKQREVITRRLSQLAAIVPTVDRPLTLADCGFPVTWCWLELLMTHMDFDVSLPPQVSQYFDRIQQHPAVAKELDNYRPALKEWLAGK
jgi:glutathione S-transferase/maleylpyruvate isomerase